MRGRAASGRDLLAAGLLAAGLAAGCGDAPVANAPPVAAEAAPAVSKRADREPPPEVAPVVVGGVRYEAIHDGRSRGLDRDGGYIAAFEPGSGRPLWTLQVYAYPIDPRREADVQDVFISSMQPGSESGTLEVRNENGEVHVVDLETRSVTRPEAAAPAP